MISKLAKLNENKTDVTTPPPPPTTIILLVFTPLQFFTSVVADDFSLGFEWPQVSSSLQDSTQYSDRSQ